MSVQIITGDCRDILATLDDESVHCCVSSPPYFGLRDYGVDGQIGLEAYPEDFIAAMVEVFREVRRVLRNDGTVWLNLGDSYSTHAAGKVDDPMAKSTLAGVRTQNVANESSRAQGRYLKCPSLPEKNLMMIPARVALALQQDGWWLRSDIIWAKPNPMPESVTDRPTSAHEHVFLLAKSAKYYFEADAVRENATMPLGTKAGYAGYSSRALAMGRNPSGNEKPDAVAFNSGFRNIRNVWTIATQPFSEAHFATFPPALVEPCIKAGCPENGTVLDPFGGAGTTGLVADRLGRNAILIELNPEYADMARRRLQADAGMFAEVS